MAACPGINSYPVAPAVAHLSSFNGVTMNHYLKVGLIAIAAVIIAKRLPVVSQWL